MLLVKCPVFGAKNLVMHNAALFPFCGTRGFGGHVIENPGNT